MVQKAHRPPALFMGSSGLSLPLGQVGPESLRQNKSEESSLTFNLLYKKVWGAR